MPTEVSTITRLGDRAQRSEEGRSLPGVLIAMGVGAILLGPFLSHVSTRMLASREVEDNLGEQYAADAGVEFASWKILNDPAFRNLADANVGTPVSVTPDITVNDELTTMEVTALPLGEWTVLANAPGSITTGGALAYEDSAVYGLQGGGSTAFWSYNIAADTWSSETSTQLPVEDGGALVSADGDLYGFHSESICTFLGCLEALWELTASGWSRTSFHPGSGFFSYDIVGPGASLAYTGGNHIFALRGNDSADFWRYSTNANNWNTRADAPGGVGAGGSLTYDGQNTLYAFQGDGASSFWEFRGNSWDTDPADPPGSVGPGGSLAADLDDYVYGLRGNSTTDFWRYNTSGDFWQPLASTPATVSNGGSLTYAGGTDFYALRGGGTHDFWRFRITPPRYDISVVAGDTTIDARIEVVGSTATVLFWDID